MHTIYRLPQGQGVYLYSVGVWVSRGNCEPDWMAVRDCATTAEAALWCNFLNGGAWPLVKHERVALMDQWDHYIGG
jgi:hypothetical protein